MQCQKGLHLGWDINTNLKPAFWGAPSLTLLQIPEPFRTADPISQFQGIQIPAFPACILPGNAACVAFPHHAGLSGPTAACPHALHCITLRACLNASWKGR